MAGATTIDPWRVDFTAHGPQHIAPTTTVWTVFKLPLHLRGKPTDYADYFKIRMLPLGLHNRAVTPEPSQQIYQNLKLKIASVLLSRLSKPPPAPAPPPASAPRSPAHCVISICKPTDPACTIRSWNGFAEAVVPDVGYARNRFEKPSDMSPPMSDEAVRDHLALDALFIVFYFQFLSRKPDSFNIEEFKTLASARITTLGSLVLSDFLLLENQVPMYLLKNVVRELCKIDDALPTKLLNSETCSEGIEPFDWLVENELNRILMIAVENLLPLSGGPTVVHPISDDDRSAIAAGCSTSDGRACISTRTSLKSASTPEKFTQVCPAHRVHTLVNCSHILDCVYRVVCGHVVCGHVACGHNEPSYQWNSCKQLENPYMELGIPSATQLEEVGIEAERSMQCTGNSVELTHGCLTWISNARLRLPKVEILDNTPRMFRNLAIYEQLLGQADVKQYNSDLRCYLVWMHELCRDTADLRLLSKRGVIDVHVEDDTALSMWAAILKYVERPIPSDTWKKCYDNLQKHQRSRWKRWRRKHIGMFLNKPWRTLSILTAVILLVLTALQTWFTVVKA